MSEMEKQTQVGTLRIRQRRSLSPEGNTPDAPDGVEWVQPEKKRAGERLLKNMAVAASLVLCAAALRTGAIPPLTGAADAVMTAATDNSLLDEQLGRLSFVSALFPEAAEVFSAWGTELALPVSGGAVTHAWSESEPYMAWRSGSASVTAAADGEVIGVYHGNGGERLVQVMGESGLSCLYGNLATVAVSAGDAVRAGEVLGETLPGADAVFEVRRNGMSVDPALYLPR